MRKTHALLISVLSSYSLIAQAQQESFSFFGGRDIDYWNEGKKVNSAKVEMDTVPDNQKKDANKNVNQDQFSGSNTIRSRDATPFEWKNYKNPLSSEFWDDGGDWIPPRPFREAVANPTDENINEYMHWQMRKTALVTRFQTALEKYGKNYNWSQNEKNKEENKETNTPAVVKYVQENFNWNKVKIAYFYQSGCSHCQNSAALIERLKNLGSQVTFVQLGSQKNKPLHAQSIPYDKEMDRDFHVTSTPTWFLKSSTSYVKLAGEQSYSNILNAAKSISKQGNMK